MKFTKEVLTMKKIFGTLLLCTLLVSAGTIYASGNPAQNLVDWYEDSFQKKGEELGAATATGMVSVFKEVNSLLKESEKDTDTAIVNLSDQQVIEAKAGIEAYQFDTSKDLYETVAELKNVNFDNYVDGLNIEAEIEQDFEKMIEEVFNE